MDEIDLAVASQFVFDGAPYQFFLEWRDYCLNCQPVARRRFDQRHVAQAHQRHMQRPWNRRRGKRQRVHVLAHFLQSFFVCHAEALLFIHNQQAEVGKLHVFRKQAMRANHDVYLAGFQICEHLLLLRGGAKAA